jgi:hypothetical protein
MSGAVGPEMDLRTAEVKLYATQWIYAPGAEVPL